MGLLRDTGKIFIQEFIAGWRTMCGLLKEPDCRNIVVERRVVRLGHSHVRELPGERWNLRERCVIVMKSHHRLQDGYRHTDLTAIARLKAQTLKGALQWITEKQKRSTIRSNVHRSRGQY
jgi:hypothetical protein